MQVDKTTLADLSIFHADEEKSVFHHLNFTLTNGGREYLRKILGKPLETLPEIWDTQNTLMQLMAVSDQWPTTTVTNGTVMVIEKFFETGVSSFSAYPNIVNSAYYKIMNAADYSLLRYSVEHTIDFTLGLQQVVDLLQLHPMSRQLTAWISRMAMLLNKPAIL